MNTSMYFCVSVYSKFLCHECTLFFETEVPLWRIAVELAQVLPFPLVGAELSYRQTDPGSLILNLSELIAGIQ